MASPRYAIGIDLGTTNSALSYTPLFKEGPVSGQVFPIAQLVSAGNVEDRELLPSFLYLPGPELPEGSTKLPWDKAREFIVGVFARTQGTQVPARFISSAKSWLCHQGLDRRSAILPWSAPEEIEKISPLEASSRYLSHLREAWDFSYPEDKLQDQEIILTVPASFDAIARELTLEAANQAGLSQVTFLEEPQAALYAWLETQGDAWRKLVSVGDVILVIDIGGGTTDLSLITVLEEDGELVLQRIAVGDHILLGGDNMDLTLAHLLNQRLANEGKKLDNWQFRALTYGCREAKEALLSDNSLESFPIVVPGRGSRLLAKSIRTELRREDFTKILLDGFFPKSDLADLPKEKTKAGLAQLGLPYASDPGISRHLAKFLCQQKQAGGDLSNHINIEGKHFIHPTAVLFNGGVLNASVLQERIINILNGWLEKDGGTSVRVLNSSSLDLSVARGASYYGQVKQGNGIRIRGGTARAYYVGIESTLPAVPGFEPPIRALCLAPFGMEEGTSSSMTKEEFGLITGEPAVFRFFASSTRRDDQVGTIIEDASELEELPSIEASLEGEPGRMVPVHLKAQVTEIGTLQLWCVKGEERWKLEFNVRIAGDD